MNQILFVVLALGFGIGIAFWWTARMRRITAKLRQSQERFQQLAWQSRSFGWEVDLDGLYTYVGDAVEAALGYRPEELEGRLYFYDLFPKDRRQKWMEWGLNVLRSGQDLVDFENKVVTKDGREVWLLSNGSSRRDRNGNIIGFRGIDIDIDGRKRAEAAEARERMLRVEKALAEARLEALRYQLNPHFLYNTLVTIEALSHESPQRIPVLIDKLAIFLRLRLKPVPGAMIPLRRELAAAQAYLDIEKVRFEQRLEICQDVDAATLDIPVPELVLQPLVENAIKYGQQRDGRLLLALRIWLQDQQLMLSVRNYGNLVMSDSAEERGGGIGLTALCERLSGLYSGRAAFDIREEGDMVVATVRLPID